LFQLRKSINLQRELERDKQKFQRELEELKQQNTLTLEELRQQFQRELEQEKQQNTLAWELERKKQQAALEKQQREEEAAEAAKQQEEANAKQAQIVKEHAKSYRSKLSAELCHMSISDLPNVPSSLNLESMYVQLQVREEELLRYAKEEEMAPLAAGEATELLRRSQVRIAKRAELPLLPEDALVKFRRIAVLGDPGGGKTTMERYLALKMAKQVEPKLPYFPIYVELGRFVESGKNDLLDFIADDLDDRYGFPNARPYLEQQLLDGKAALLLDGLDEVVGGATQTEAQAIYKQVADEINRLATRFSQISIVITCRKAGWRGGLKQFQTLEVLDFSWEQIQEFVNRWFDSNPTKAEGLRTALAENLRMQMLAANPLILSLIAIVYQKDLELPERRAQLYNRCLEVLLQEWDSRRNIKRFSQFTTDRKRDLLEEVAWHFQKSGKRYFSEDELLEVIADFLPTINIPREDNKAILEEIAAQYGLLKEQAHGWYGFGHLTFQEYFAALAVKDKGAIALLEVVARCHEPWWEEVILLLAGMMNDATPLLLGILGHSINLHSLPEGNLAANDDLFHSDLLLAAHCLAYARRITITVLKDRIIAEVKNLLLTSPYKFDWERTTTVLVEINDKALIDELLAMLAYNGINEEKRRSIASAFGKLADQSVAQRLLELLKSNPELDLFVRLSIIDALGALKATFAVSSLQEMLATENTTDAKERIIRTLGVIGNKEVASSLLDRLLDTTTDPKIKLSIAQALRNLKDESLTHRILEQLQDETIEWQVRWLLTESLEGLQESAKDSLMEMLESQAIDEPVRVGIAATLGTWGVRESIHYLRNAIEKKVVPPSWQQGYYTISGYIWGRITRVLNSLGDESVVPILKQSFIQSPAIPDKWAAINALLEYKDKREEIARQVLELARFPSYFGKGSLLVYMRRLATESLVPELRTLLTQCSVYGIDEWGHNWHNQWSCPSSR